MKKEQKRYFLVEYAGIVERKAKNLSEIDSMIEKVKSHNKKIKTKKYYFGNITYHMNEDGTYKFCMHGYNKLTVPMTISDLDDLTSQYTEEELSLLYKEKMITKDGYIPDINIAYFITKENDSVIRRIDYIPILYKDDVKFMDMGYIKKCVAVHSKERDYPFFLSLASRVEKTKNAIDDIERLRINVNKMYSGEIFSDDRTLYQLGMSLIKSVVADRDKNGRIMLDNEGYPLYSKRRLRDIGFYIRDYKVPESKIPSPLRHNKLLTTVDRDEIAHQRKLSKK